jgi:RNA polymerase sigma-70 factor, ECF subfamily
MNCVGQGVLIESADELDIKREDPLVTAVQAGVPEAFAQLHAIYSRRLYRTIVRITKSPEDAEDALQDTFLRAHLALDTFEGRSSIYSWLTRIAMNSALMVLRKRGARGEVLFDLQRNDRSETIIFEVKDSAPNPEEAYDLYERQLKTLQAISCLDPHLREPIRMQVIHGWSVSDISCALNISEAAVKSRLCRARKRLSVKCAGRKRYGAHTALLLSESKESLGTTGFQIV